MVDPFLDPLDTAPLNRSVPSIPSRNGSDDPGSVGTFQNVLSREIKQEPTPLLTPDALRAPTPQSKYIPPSPGGNNSSIPIKDNVNLSALPPMDSPQETPESSSVEISTSPVASVESSSGTEPKRSLAELLNLRVQGAPEETSVAPEPAKKSQPEPVSTASAVTESSPEQGAASLQTSYTVQRGDTLSQIVASSMHDAGIDYSVGDLYRMVRSVAAQNQIRNPDRIYAGSTVDLTPIYSGGIISKAVQPQPLSGTPGIQSPVCGEITSEFGNRLHPVSQEEKFHNGIDIAANIGTPIHPMKPGTVSFSGEKSGYGQVVEVDHGDGLVSVYGHLSDRRVSVGDVVASDEVVGLSGETGLTTGPHLHFEIRESGHPIDPLTVLPRKQIENPSGQIARGDLP